jgi:hypothetical protein
MSFSDWKEELAYAKRSISEWYGNYDNRVAAWIIVTVTAVVALVVYGTLFFGGRAAYYGLTEQTVIAIDNDSLCLTTTGKVRRDALPACFDGPNPAVLKQQSASENGQVNANQAVYDPPCVRDGKPGCSDKITGKRLIEGLVGTVTYNSDEKTVDKDHLQPDYTEIKFYAEYDDQQPPDNEKFCGNMLHRFTPGQKIKFVINESKQADYNGCYTIEPILLTFGGDPRHVVPHPNR